MPPRALVQKIAQVPTTLVGTTDKKYSTHNILYRFIRLLYIYEMSEIKDKLKGVKDKVVGAGEDAKDTVTGHDTSASGDGGL